MNGMRLMLSLLISASVTASARTDPVLFEYAPNLTPYQRLCLAAENIYPHEMRSADVQWLRATIQAAVQASKLPILPERHRDCAPMRLKAAGTDAVLFVEVAPSLKRDQPWQLQLRIVDPHLLGANGNVYQPILWELRHTIGPAKSDVTAGLRGAFDRLRKAWSLSRRP